jgi:hypothetical protein
VNVRNRYLGLRFVIHGKIHYGWARLSVKVTRTEVLATLTGYAYETIPNKPILAGEKKESIVDRPGTALTAPTPEPATLGALAMGARGLSIWRKEWAEGAR